MHLLLELVLLLEVLAGKLLFQELESLHLTILARAGNHFQMLSLHLSLRSGKALKEVLRQFNLGEIGY